MDKPRYVDLNDRFTSEKYRVSAHLPASLLTWGKIEVLGDRVLRAGEPCTLRIAVTLDKAIPAGHSLEIWTHFVSDIQRPQLKVTEDSSERSEGTASSSNDGASFTCQVDPQNVVFTPCVRPEAKVHGPGTFFPYRRYAGVALPEGAPQGTRFVFMLEDVSMQTYEETLFNLRFAVLKAQCYPRTARDTPLQDDTLVGYLGDAFYVVIGNEKKFLRIIAPTCMETEQAFDKQGPSACQIIVCDQYGNKTGDDDLEDLTFEVKVEQPLKRLLRTVSPRVVYDADKRLHTIQGLSFAQPGVYYIRAALEGAPDICGISNPIVVKDTWPEKIYWGDLHQHTYFADGRGTPAANYEYAISTSCLDFCAVAPHQESTYAPGLLRVEGAPVQKGWEELTEAAEAYNGAGIVTILGSEAGSLARIAGHMNSYYLDVDNRPELERLGLEPREHAGWGNLTEDERAALYQRYLDELERSKGEILLLPHAHACGGPGKFDLPLRPTYQTNVEICSVHGVFEAFYRQWLKHGHFVGVHGSGDNHMTSTGNGNPGWHYPNTNGLAATFAPAWTRGAIWDAIKHRRTYAVTGNQRIYLDFASRSQTSDAQHHMGAIIIEETSEANIANPREIRLDVAGTAPVMKVELFKNNDVIHTYRPPLNERRYLRLTWTDSWGSRRVDDSLTTGEIAAQGGLSVVKTLNMFHRTDKFEERDEGVKFRSNGYSGITRGVILDVQDSGGFLHYQIKDTHLEKTVLEQTLEVPLAERHTALVQPLNVEERFIRSCFTREPQRPEFILNAEWIDLGWPKVVQLTWQDDDDTPAYYYVRVEQIDGNIAWSSPIWFAEQVPFEA
jgi:hypothetical protein